MSVLSSLLARDQVVAVKKIEEAIQRQVISGGELPTVLLEVGAASENVIAAYHAAAVDLVPASRDEVMEAGEEVTRALPRALVERFHVVPLAVESNTLVVAGANPLPSAALSEIGEATGLRVEVRIATEPRIAAAMQHHFGIAPIARMRRLISKLASQDAGEVPEVSTMVENRRNTVSPLSGSMPTGPASWARAATAGATADSAIENKRVSGANARTVVVSSAPAATASAPETESSTSTSTSISPLKPVSVVSVGVSRVVGVGTPSKTSSVDYRRASLAPQDSSVSAAPIANQELPTSPVAEEPTRPRDSGTLGVEAAIAALADAHDRHEILTSALAHVRTYFSYCAVFAVHEDFAEGLDAYGDGVSAEAVRGIGIDLTRPGTARDVRELLGAKAGTLDGSDADRELAAKLDRVAKQPSVIIPVSIRQRVIFLFYGDRAGAPVGLGDIAELIAFLPRVSEALQRLILQKKSKRSDRTYAVSFLKSDSIAPWSKGDSDTERDSTPEASPPIDAPEEAQPEPSFASEAAPLGSASSSGSVPAESERPREFDLLGVPRRAPEPPSLSSPPRPASEPAEAPRHSLRPLAETMYRGAAPEEEVVLTRRKPRGSARPSQPANQFGAVRSEINVPPAAALPVEASTLVDARRPDSFDDSENGEDSDESEAPEISVSDASTATSSEATIITDLGLDLDDLVDDLLNATRDSVAPHVEKLVGFGEPALRVLARRFPGPLWTETGPNTDPVQLRARDIGPILYAMVQFRGLSVAHIANLLDQRDPAVRYYAALLAAEITHRDLVVRVGRRVLDDDANVRVAALTALRAAKRFEGEIAEVLTHFRRVAGNDRAPLALRRLAVELLGELRDGDGVTMLVDTLGDPDVALAQTAREALRRITKQDFGATTASWQSWLTAHGDEHRVEWLIDALLRDEESMRREAGDELKVATKEFFGFQAALPRKEREVVHRKYRKWWDSIGRSRFHRVS